jgi:hypothetical protein
MAELNKTQPAMEKLDKRPDVPKIFLEAFKTEPIKPRTGFETGEIVKRPNKKESVIVKAIKLGRRFFNQNQYQ